MTVSFTESLINLEIDFSVSKLFELPRVYEECFKDFHRRVNLGSPIKDLKYYLNEESKFFFADFDCFLIIRFI
jgi:hypothetical protein